MMWIKGSRPEMREATGFRGTRAVVLGAGMAGLVAAKVLADHFERVTIVEHDRLPSAPEVRRSVPQGRHLHVLLGAGLNTISQMFPGIVAELVGAGAVLRDFGESVAWFHGGAWKVQFPSGVPLLQCSRALLEHHLRQRVRSLPNVEILDETTAAGLRLSADRTRVTGVLLERSARAPDDIPAELVVDAGGRSSRAPQWLEAAGCARPPESRVHIDIAYVSRLYRPPARSQHSPLFLAISPRPPMQKRGGFMYSIEGGIWCVSLYGACGDHPPLDDAGFVEFARWIERPELHELIKDAEPLTAPTTLRFTADRRRHFERMKRHLEGFLVLGDAACAFDPIFAQGMSVACLGARALERCLREQARGDVRGLARRFQRDLAAVTDLPWQLATTEDLRFPEAKGKRPLWFGALTWYNGKLAELSAYDTEIYGRWLLVLHLTRRLTTCFAPSVVLAVLGHSLRSALRAPEYRARAAVGPLRARDPATRARVAPNFAAVTGDPLGSERGSKSRRPRAQGQAHA